MASRSFWVLLVAMGPLVGWSFISAVRIYGEASGLNGTSAGVGEAFSPLIGVWAPTFSACEIAAAFLLPFVAIRQVSADRHSGAQKIVLQHSVVAFSRMSAKALVLLAGWAAASLAPAIAVLLWLSYGGAFHSPEVATVVFGHFLNAGITVALAAATGAVAEHPSTAAILTLGVTVGTWILNFAAAIHGGWWETAAGYTPAAMVATFQHGLLRLDAVLVSVALTLGGLGIAAIWTRLGVADRRRIGETAAVLLVTMLAASAGAAVRGSWDLSENRANSFGTAEEAALRRIHGPLRIEVHLAPEDPRRVDLERRALGKLQRAMRDVDVRYVATTTTGLFEQTTEHYGEIRYELNGRTATSRATTAEGVLETIFTLSGETLSEGQDGTVFRGHPLAVEPSGAALVFYGLWPAAVAAAAWIIRRRT
jgi:hypothetical protein